MSDTDEVPEDESKVIQPSGTKKVGEIEVTWLGLQIPPQYQVSLVGSKWDDFQYRFSIGSGETKEFVYHDRVRHLLMKFFLSHESNKIDPKKLGKLYYTHWMGQKVLLNFA